MNNHFNYQGLVRGAACYIIAEIGVNHGGNMDLARRMIDAAKQAGADAVKFQTYNTDTLATRETPKVLYQERSGAEGETHFEMLRQLEFKREDHFPIKTYCETQGIDFMSTPYDVESAVFLNQLNVAVFKTASADIVDLPLQTYLAKTGKPVIVSTGMSTLGEIDTVVNLYRATGNTNLALLHCVSNYPCSIESLNLNVIPTMQSAFHTLVGYSDHSKGALAAVVSVSLGAKIIEKHLTLDKGLPGPDHAASDTPEEFQEMVSAVRNAEKMLGEFYKEVQEEEKQMARISRKSIVTARDLRAGEKITREDLAVKRPGVGLLSSSIPDVVGKVLRHDVQRDQLLDWKDFE